ncbi:MAG: DUF1858 domain-containing protein [Oscillospiraceae bacterium]|nr:DUF1858 domain-containing protein [Oscillospiraceae bacterium]MBR2805772.1 DUF1858 domain-containing protein [Oscillospiraceae bacterium]
MVVTKDTIIGDIIMFDEDSAGIFMKNGMHCIGCPASWGETVEQACMVHGLEYEGIVDMLNAYFKARYPDLVGDAE